MILIACGCVRLDCAGSRRGEGRRRCCNDARTYIMLSRRKCMDARREIMATT